MTSFSTEGNTLLADDVMVNTKELQAHMILSSMAFALLIFYSEQDHKKCKAKLNE